MAENFNSAYWPYLLKFGMTAPTLTLADAYPPKTKKVVMTPYQSDALMVKVKRFLKGWKIQTTEKAVAFYSPYEQRPPYGRGDGSYEEQQIKHED